MEIPFNSAGYNELCKMAKQGRGKKSLNVSVDSLNRMLEEYEDLLDIVAYDEAKKRNEEYFPHELVSRLIDGENHLKVYREYRKLTQQALANASGVSRDMIAMIETGKKNGSLATVKKLAAALDIEIEDLV